MPTPETRILVLHGPNLNLLGQREPETYGSLTLTEIEDRMAQVAAELGVLVICRQSNHEGVLVDWLQGAAGERFGAVVLNPGAYTHTSLALRDAMRAIALPVVEVHLSNLYGREEFRRHSWTSGVACGVIMGLGADSYLLGLRAAAHLARTPRH